MPPTDIPQPGVRITAVAVRALGVVDRVLQPKLYGVDWIPDRGPFLLVGNHTLYGLQDVPSLIYEIHRARGIHVRALGDHVHFGIPLWRTLLCDLGMVRGTRENCAALLQAGEAVMVFPGGAHEVFKRRHEHYNLMWRERIGFARLAVEHGCPIIPFSAVGADDTYTVLLDAEHPLIKPIRLITDRVTGRPETFIPVSRGVGLTLIPRPERFYFRFAPPIDTTPLAGHHNDLDALRALRDQVKSGVEDGIRFLLAERDRDPHRRLIQRLGRAVRGGKGEHVPFAIASSANGQLDRHGLISPAPGPSCGPEAPVQDRDASRRPRTHPSHAHNAPATARRRRHAVLLETVAG